MPLSKPFLSYRVRSTAARYGLAPLGIGAATLISVALHDANIRGTPFLPFIMVIAWYGGWGPGLLAAALSSLSLHYFILEPRFTFVTLRDTWYLVTFTLSAGFVAWLTGRQRKAQDVLEQQARLLDLSHDAVFVRDPNDVITYWNRGAEERYGWTQAEALGKSSHDLNQTVFPVPLPEIEEELRRTGRWEGQLTHTRRDGSRVVVASRWSEQRDEGGTLVGVLETNNDISEQLRAAEAWRQSEAQLAHVSRLTMLGEITASMAHEINQPLAAVVMNANACRRWLEASPPNVEEAIEAARRIAADGERAGQVIGRVRSVVRKQAPEPSPVNVNDVIQETLAFTRVELEQHRVVVRAALAADLPPAVGDRIQLQQVLVNLILNGIDAMSATEMRSRVLTIESFRADADHIAVSVSDRGKGLSPEHADHIFETFYSTKPNGLGMGLSVSRSIIEQHGGKIWAEPNVASGATLRFTLPAGAA
jgi:two-component system, LuxR family, sensor kinase FixL